MNLFEAVTPGSEGWVDLDFGGSSPVRAFLRRGSDAGPRTVVTAGVHGDEYEGPAAVFDLVEDLRQCDLRGAIVLIPVANPSAFTAATRTSPEDGENLARTFPGNKKGSPTERLAAALFESIRDANHLIDLHSGGVACEFWPVAGFYGPASNSNPSFLAASWMGLPGLWRLPATPGVLSHEMAKRGTIAVGCEYRGGGRLDPMGHEAYRIGVKQVLAHWGHLPDLVVEERDRTVVPSFKGDWTLAAEEGLFEGRVKPGDRVTVGTELASIRGFTGEIRETIVSDREGMILAMRTLASIRRGDWAVLVSVESGHEHG